MTRRTHPVFCAIDTPDLANAKALADVAAEAGFGIKLGKEFFAANGPEGVREVREPGTPLFLDVKFHDIPNTVAGAIRSAATLAPTFITVHAAGGPAMLRAAAAAAAEFGAVRPKLLGVTVLTSLDAGDLAATGVTGTVEQQVLRLGRLAIDCGLDGLICAPQEIVPLRAAIGTQAVLVVPGIRPAGSDAGDQKRVMTPREALKAGADWLVIGRPITAAPDPAAAVAAIAAEIAA
jgi:orotidine-5'-phosphate decarboxylase